MRNIFAYIKCIYILIFLIGCVAPIQGLMDESLFLQAVEQGDIGIVEKYINSDVDLNTKDSNRNSALLRAIARGHIDIADLLIEEGADVNIASKYNYTPLHSASYHGYVTITEKLIKKGANINAREQLNYATPLMYAVGAGQTEIVRLLVQANANIHLKGKNGDTAITLAEDGGFEDIITILNDAAQN